MTKLDETRVGQDHATSRVSMVWPADIKEQVRKAVGGRGLTEFTVDAVRDKLARMQTAVSSEPPEPESQHVNGVAKPDTPDGRRDDEPADPGEGFAMAPAEVAKLPLVQRMAYARGLINDREPAPQSGLHCGKCGDELVNGECWTCPPSYGSQA